MSLFETVLAYAAVASAAAVPVLEVLLVIPPAIAAGLHPVAVGIAAFAGNLVGVVVFLAAGDRIRRWWSGRRSGEPKRSRGRERALRAFSRWGLPGLAVLAPLTTGSHLAVLLAVTLKASRRAIFAWFTASLAAWSVIVTAVSVAGVALW